MPQASDSTKNPGQITPATASRTADLVSYGTGSVVSRTIHKGNAANLTVFAFDAGQELSEHTSPYDAFVHVIEGRADLVIGGKEVRAAAGEIVHMPAGVPHAIRAPERFKMLLVMLRG